MLSFPESILLNKTIIKTVQNKQQWAIKDEKNYNINNHLFYDN